MYCIVWQNSRQIQIIYVYQKVNYLFNICVYKMLAECFVIKQ
jgi:hypothetical protein